MAASSTGADAAGVKTATETRARQSSFLAAGVIFFCLLLFPLFYLFWKNEETTCWWKDNVDAPQRSITWNGFFCDDR